MTDIDGKRRKVRQFFAIFGVVLMGIGIVMTAFTTRAYLFGEESRTWPKTMGVIISSEVIKNDTARSENGITRNSISYSPAITYSYTVQDKRYSSTRVSFNPIGGSQRSQSQHYVSKFAAGNIAPVYYDSEHPATATLEQGTSTVSLFAVIGGLAFLLFGFLIYRARSVYAQSISG